MRKITIELVDWDSHCADRCCYEYGTTLIVDGEELEHPDDSPENFMTNRYVGMDVKTSLEAVLKHLGYEVEIIQREEE
jgi:hypothetical protein